MSTIWNAYKLLHVSLDDKTLCTLYLRFNCRCTYILMVIFVAGRLSVLNAFSSNDG